MDGLTGPERQAYVAAALEAAGLCPRGTRSTFHTRRPESPRRGTASTLCSGCKGPRDRGPEQRYCRACHAAHARATRPKHSELDPEARKRANCRRVTGMLVARGKIDKTPCGCGATDVSAVHHDWNDPRAVTWQCDRCRRAATNRHVAAA